MNLKYKEDTNFYIIPRASDGKLINGSYNRVWKIEKFIGALNVCNVLMTGEKDDMEQLRIRKITPKEAWRLMGFDDKVFEKASKVNSDSNIADNFRELANKISDEIIEKTILKYRGI